MPAQITKDTTLAELETIIQSSVDLMKNSRLPFDETRIRKDMRQRLAEMKGVKVEDLDALEAAAAPPVVAPKPKTAKDAKDTMKRLRGQAASGRTYFYEKAEDTAVTDVWIGLNRDAAVHMHMLNVGPSGCGKTEGLRLAAERSGIPFYKIDCASITTSDKWVGHKEVDEKGTHFVLSEHLRWLQAIDCEPGLVLYDEINRLHPSLLNILIPILDGSKSIWVPDLGTYISVHEKTLIAATANIGVGFSGTYGLDIALHDRFGLVLERNFPPLAEEVKILVNRTGIDDVSAKTLVEIAGQIRTKAIDGTVSKPVSTRALLDTAALVSAGMSVIDASEYTWVKKYPDEGGASSERATVRTILTGKAAGRRS
jgi:MoxR-like ATPase